MRGVAGFGSSRAAACILAALCGFVGCDEELQAPETMSGGAAGDSAGCASCASATAGEGGSRNEWPEFTAGVGGVNQAGATSGGGGSSASGAPSESGAASTPSAEGGAASADGAAGAGGDGTRDFEAGNMHYCEGATFPPLQHVCFPPSTDPSYTFQMSLFIRGGAMTGQAPLSVAAMNVHGVAVGTLHASFTKYDESTGVTSTCGITRAFAYGDGTFTYLPPDGERNSRAFGINAHGVIVGTANNVPVLWRDGQIRRLIGDFSSLSRPITINDNGQVLIRTLQKSELWSSRGVQLIGEMLYAHGLNNAGQVVGNDLQSHTAFLWQDGEVRSLPPLEGHRSSSAAAINDAGVVVGSSSSSDGLDRRAVIWEDGMPRELVSPLGADCEIIDINNQGVYLLAHEGSMFTYLDGTLRRVTDTVDSAMSLNHSGVVLGNYVWSPGCYDTCCETESP